MGQGGEGAEGGAGFMGMLPFVAILVIMWFLLIRPQQRRQKQTKFMQDNLKVGDRVSTTGGLHGTVAAVSEHSVTLKVAEKVKIDFDKSAIVGLRSAGTDSSN